MKNAKVRFIAPLMLIAAAAATMFGATAGAAQPCENACKTQLNQCKAQGGNGCQGQFQSCMQQCKK